MPLRAEELDEYVEVLAPVDGRGDDGTPTVEFVPESAAPCVYASIEPLRAQERVQGTRVKGTVTHRIRMRHFPELTTRHQLRLGARVFEIEAVLHGAARGVETSAICMESEAVDG